MRDMGRRWEIEELYRRVRKCMPRESELILTPRVSLENHFRCQYHRIDRSVMEAKYNMAGGMRKPNG